MFTKALFVNIEREMIPEMYFSRLTKLFKQHEFIRSDDPKFLTSLADTDLLFTRIENTIDTKIIDAAPNLQYIGLLGTSFDGVDLAYARSKHITVCNLGGYSTESVAEFFFAALFEYARSLARAQQNVAAANLSPDSFKGFALKGKTLGVIGAGRIGSRTAEMGLGIGMNVVYFDRNDKPHLDKLGAQRTTLDTVLAKSDCLSLNLALNTETEGILNKDKIALMKQGCIFINLAPRRLIDQDAVLARAQAGEITFISYLSYDTKPEQLKKFIGIPHCVVYPPIMVRTQETQTARWETFVSNVENFVAGKPQNKVN
jgi:phosphoglycerate dehydrogenase-like enzyme